MKTVMKDYSKRKEARYVVVGPGTYGNPFGWPISWHPSLKAALKAHPDAKPARGCTKADGTFEVVK